MTEIARAYPNPLSPSLHPIPANCPACSKPQYDGERALGGEITDVELEDGTWTVVHVECLPNFNREEPPSEKSTKGINAKPILPLSEETKAHNYMSSTLERLDAMRENPRKIRDILDSYNRWYQRQLFSGWFKQHPEIHDRAQKVRFDIDEAYLRVIL